MLIFFPGLNRLKISKNEGFIVEVLVEVKNVGIQTRHCAKWSLQNLKSE